MNTLNAQQQAAVKAIDHPLLVLAGAGSGKTRVITEKIAYLIAQGLPARHIAAVTFTNKAAREMKSRVGKLLKDKDGHGLRVSTFHSLGLDILRKEHKTLGYKAAITLFDEQDKQTLLKNLIAHGSTALDKDKLDHYAAQIGQWKNAFVTPEQALAADGSAVAVLYDDYTRSLYAYNAVDFDDLLLQPVLLFQQHPTVLEKWQNRIRYLLVDEYQDTNITQYQLLRLLAGTMGRFTVVGDDDQSIYTWRGANSQNLSQLQQDYARLQVIKLEQNYRSTGRILKAANHLIANNPHSFEKKLWSELGYGEPLRVLSHKSEQDEARQVVSEIIYHKFKSGGLYSDYAILYRGNHQSRLFEQSLRANSIPYFLSGGTSFFSYTEVKDILCYLRVLSNHHDDAALLRIINTPRREIGPTTLEKLGAYAKERHISLFAASGEFGLQQRLAEQSAQRLQQFSHWLSNSAAKLQQGDTFAVIEQLIEQIGYQQYLREDSKSKETAERRWRNVQDLLAWLQRLATDENDTLTDLINKIQLIDILERGEQEQNNDAVSLMTLHAAKGLEFLHVFLVGIEENILPHSNSIETDNIEEERRLAYVGITRAQRTCTLSYCTHRKRYGDTNACEPSRFLNELPDDDLEWASKKQLPAEVQKERGRASLAHLKTILS